MFQVRKVDYLNFVKPNYVFFKKIQVLSYLFQKAISLEDIFI